MLAQHNALRVPLGEAVGNGLLSTEKRAEGKRNSSFPIPEAKSQGMHRCGWQEDEKQWSNKNKEANEDS